jgi:hypothetical protein
MGEGKRGGPRQTTTEAEDGRLVAQTEVEPEADADADADPEAGAEVTLRCAVLRCAAPRHAPERSPHLRGSEHRRCWSWRRGGGCGLLRCAASCAREIPPSRDPYEERMRACEQACLTIVADAGAGEEEEAAACCAVQRHAPERSPLKGSLRGAHARVRAGVPHHRC